MEIRKGSIGDEDVARIYTGDDIVYPLPVQDGVILWYDFMGRRNSDAKRGIAEDLSGNGSDGELSTFAYEEGSGYEDGLRFDGVDDNIKCGINTEYLEEISYSFLFNLGSYREVGAYQCLLYWNSPTYMMIRNNANTLFFSFATDGERPQVTRDTGLTIIPGETYFITVTYDGEVVKVFNHGQLVDEFSCSGKVQISSTATIGRFSNAMGFFDGVAHSLILYRRALEIEEVAHNYAIEKERWNL